MLSIFKYLLESLFMKVIQHIKAKRLLLKTKNEIEAELTATAIASLLVRSAIRPTYAEEQEELNQIYRLKNLKASLPDRYEHFCIETGINPSRKFKNKLY